MNRALKFLFSLLMLASLPTICATKACCGNSGSNCGTGCNSNCCNNYDNCINIGECDGYPYLQARSQGRDAARRLVGTQEFVNKWGADSTNGIFSIAAQYSQSFWNERLAHFLFGSNLVDCYNLLIQGNEVKNKNSQKWIAEYFGLPADYNSKVSFCPKIQNVIVDLDFYLGLDGWHKGLYTRLDSPIAWTKWQLCPHEKIINSGTRPFVAGYMAETEIVREDLPSSFLQVMRGGTTFGDMKSPMKFGKFNDSCNCNTEVGIAELNFTFGWNFHLAQDHHFGLFLYTAAPTGTRPSAINLFEPIIGNGKHWELGGGVSGSWIFWRSEKHASSYMGFWLDATVATLFKTCQCRSFDFKGEPISRYILVEEMEKAPTPEGLTGQPVQYTPATYQYSKNLLPAINLTTFKIDVSIPVQGDIALKFGAVIENWGFDLGYNLWARAGEKFYDCYDNCLNLSNPDSIYQIKGDITLYGKYTMAPAQAVIVTTGQTEHSSTLHAFAATDNPQDAYFTSNGHNPIISLISSDTLQTSIQPIARSMAEIKKLLNLGRSPSSITHKLFTNISYVWKNEERRCTPLLGIGGDIELSQDRYKKCCCDCGSCDSCCNSYGCNSCGNCDRGCNIPRGAVSLWGIWVKGGVAFD